MSDTQLVVRIDWTLICWLWQSLVACLAKLKWSLHPHRISKQQAVATDRVLLDGIRSVIRWTTEKAQSRAHSPRLVGGFCLMLVVTCLSMQADSVLAQENSPIEEADKAATKARAFAESSENSSSLHLTAHEAKEAFAEFKPAWGVEKLGVQFAISHVHKQTDFRIGTRIPLMIWVKNVSNELVNVKLYADFFWFTPTLVDHQNDSIKLEKFYVNGVLSNLYHQHTLKPGEAFGVHHPGIGLGGRMAKGKLVAEAASNSPFDGFPFLKQPRPGKYTLSQVHQLNVAIVEDAKSAADRDWSTGKTARFASAALDVEIKPAAPNQAANVLKRNATYESGYDPSKTLRHNIRVLPDDAWSKPVNGVQAAIAGPRKVRRSAVSTFHLVLRNASQQTIRLTLPTFPGLAHIRPEGSTISYGLNKPVDYVKQVKRWKIEPGHQVVMPLPPVQMLAPGDFGLNRALTSLTPGAHTLYVRTGASKDLWVDDGNGKQRKVALPQGEWRGWISPPRFAFELLKDKAPFAVASLKDLPIGHGIKHLVATPTTFNDSATEWIKLRYGLDFGLDSSKDEHWLRDFATYNRIVFWGPIPATKLKELKLLKKLEDASERTVKNSKHQFQIDHRIAVLVKSKQPLAELGLSFVPIRPKREFQGRIPSDYLVRTIRDRRVELEAMGLKLAVQRALNILSADDLPMPDDSQFNIISTKSLPKGLSVKSWGPINDGISAAVLMPQVVRHGTAEVARLFIRNVSPRDIRLAVSNRSGYDYATAVDAKGYELKSMRPLIYPMGFSGAIYPELNPGQSAQSPPNATLLKILLKPGAVWELETHTALSFNVFNKSAQSFGGSDRDNDGPAVTNIKSEPTVANVTWHIHAANGASYSKDLKQRLWPAKGSWTGLLKTAPIQVQLQP